MSWDPGRWFHLDDPEYEPDDLWDAADEARDRMKEEHDLQGD